MKVKCVNCGKDIEKCGMKMHLKYCIQKPASVSTGEVPQEVPQEDKPASGSTGEVPQEVPQEDKPASGSTWWVLLIVPFIAVILGFLFFFAPPGDDTDAR